MAIVGDLATNVAASFIYDGLKRPITAISNEIIRREQINNAIGDKNNIKSAKFEKTINKSVEDLSRVIGNATGKLTENVAAYLREMQRTALPETLANSVLCGSDPSEIFPAFDLFHKKFEDIPFSSEQIFNGLHQAMVERIENVGDKALLDIVRAQHSDLTAKLRLITQSLTNGAANGAILPPSLLADARLKVAKSIENLNRYVSVETLQGSKKYALKNLAIPGRLTELDQANIQSAKVPNDGTFMNYTGFRRSFDRAIILGDPGGGKSTLTQLLSYDLANMISLEAANPGRREFESRDLKLPLRIILRSFEVRQNANPSYNFFDYIRDDIKIAVDNNSELASSFLATILSSGEALILFDGLDEVLDVGARRDLVTNIEQFANIYAACPLLVTSRLVGYRDAPLCPEFKPYGLARFDLQEITKYSENSIRAVGRVKLQEAKVKAAEFIQQTNKIGGDIRENPLMLGLMVQIFVYRGDVPSNRPEVYKECATLIFEKWDGRRDIVAKIPRQDMELLDVFGYVANKTFGNAAKEEGVSKKWLFDELKSHFEDWYVDKASATRSANSLVEFLTGRAWVMSEVGHEVFKFTHRTFLEYFFARNLISESKGLDDLIQKQIIPHIINNEWVVISHLALHMAIFRDGGKTRQAAEAIVFSLENLVLPAKQELAFLEFIASALDYFLIPEGLYVKVLTLVCNRVIHLGARERFDAISVLWTLFYSANHRSELATKTISQCLAEALKQSRSPEFLFSVYAIGARRPDGMRNFRRGPITRLETNVWRKFEPLRLLKKTDILSEAKKYPEAARAYIYTYSDCRSDMYSIHGSVLLENAPSGLVPIGSEEILSAALVLASASLLKSKRNIVGVTQNEIDDCISFIAKVASDYSAGLLDRSKLFVFSKTDQHLIEREVDNTFQNIWQAMRKTKILESEKQGISDLLVCVIILMDQTIDGDQRSLPRYGRGEYMAPIRVIKEMIEFVRGTTHSEILMRWVSPRYEADTEQRKMIENA